MEIIEVQPQEAETVRLVMQRAFAEYNHDSPPSGAMQETTESIYTTIAEGEETAAVCYVDDRAAGVVRVKEEENALYFFRLSVPPEERGRGIGTALVQWIEKRAISLGKQEVYCKVRGSTPHNVKRYERLGYHVFDTYMVEKPEWPAFQVISMKKIIQSTIKS